METFMKLVFGMYVAVGFGAGIVAFVGCTSTVDIGATESPGAVDLVQLEMIMAKTITSRESGFFTRGSKEGKYPA